MVTLSPMEAPPDHHEGAAGCPGGRHALLPVSRAQARYGRPLSFYYFEHNRICKINNENISLEAIFEVASRL